MCDLLDDPGAVTAPSSRKNSNAEALGLTLGKFFLNFYLIGFIR